MSLTSRLYITLRGIAREVEDLVGSWIPVGRIGKLAIRFL